MKIVYVVHNYTNSAGMERVLSIKSNYFISKGFSVSIISVIDDKKTPFFEYDPKISIYKLGIRNSEKYKDIFLQKLAKKLNELKPDITISTGRGLVRYLYKVNDNSKKILELHFSKYKRKFELAYLDNFAIGRFLTDLYSLKRTNIAKQYDKFVVLTEEDKDSWRHLSNIEVIPNPISFIPEKFSECKEKRVIAVGRYTYQKGFDLLLNIWAKMNKDYPDWKLCIYGGGKKKAQFEKIIHKYKMNNVELLPPTSEISKEFINSSVFVMTSRYEGFSLVLAEAMSCGLPAVSYACKCGPRDIITQNEDGFLVKYGDSKEFTEKLKMLMSDQYLRLQMGKKASSNIQRFSEEKIMNQWISLFRKL